MNLTSSTVTIEEHAVSSFVSDTTTQAPEGLLEGTEVLTSIAEENVASVSEEHAAVDNSSLEDDQPSRRGFRASVLKGIEGVLEFVGLVSPQVQIQESSEEEILRLKKRIAQLESELKSVRDVENSNNGKLEKS